MIAFGADALLTWLLLSLFCLQKLLPPYSNRLLTRDHGYQRSLRQLRQLRLQTGGATSSCAKSNRQHHILGIWTEPTG